MSDYAVSEPVHFSYNSNNPDVSVLPGHKQIMESVLALPGSAVEEAAEQENLVEAELGAGAVEALSAIDPGETAPTAETSHNDRTAPGLETFAIAKAHLEIMDAMQLGRLTARARYRRGHVPDLRPGARGPRPLPRGFWLTPARLETRPGVGTVAAGFVPDYILSSVGPALSFDAADPGGDIWLDDGFVEVDVSELANVLRSNHPHHFGPKTRPRPLDGVFKPVSVEGRLAWQVGFGGMQTLLRGREGFAALYILLHLPGQAIPWDDLLTACERLPDAGLSVDAAVAAAKANAKLFVSNRMTQFHTHEDLRAARAEEARWRARAAEVDVTNPARAAVYREKAAEAVAFLQNASGQRRTDRSQYWKARDKIAQRVLRVLDLIALELPLLAGHLGGLRLADRHALVLGERTVAYVPETPVVWDLAWRTNQAG